MKKNFIIISLLISALLFTMNCNVAKTVNPGDVITGFTTSEPGTTAMRASMAYPAQGAIGVPIDADVIILCTKDVDSATLGAVSITPAMIPAPTITCSNNVITIHPNVNYSVSTLYTVSVGAALKSLPVTPGGYLIDAPYSWTFTTGTNPSSADLPHAVAASQYPINGSINLSVHTAYLEISFTKSMNPATVTTASFTVNDGALDVATSGVTHVAGTNTYRLDLAATLTYFKMYTVKLDTSLIKDMIPNNLVDDDGTVSGFYQWTFTTEANPNSVGSIPTLITNPGIDTVNATSAFIYFNTNLPVSISKCHILYSIAAGPPYAFDVTEGDWDADAITDHSVHRINLPGLTAGSIYYFRIWVDCDNDTTVNAGDLDYGEYTIITKTSVGGGAHPLNVAANNQNNTSLSQNADGSNFTFWNSNAHDVYGQYFATNGSLSWGASGAAITATASTCTNIQATPEKFINDDSLVTYKIGDTIYGKLIGGALSFKLGGNSTFDGLSLAATKTGSAFTVVMTCEQPRTLSSGTAKATTNLLYDPGASFSTYPWLNVNDLLLTNTVSTNWTSSSITLVNPCVIASGTPTGLGVISNYFIADIHANFSPVSPADGINTSNLKLSSTTNLAAYITGVVSITIGGEWAAVSSNATNALGESDITLDRSLLSFMPGPIIAGIVSDNGIFTSPTQMASSNPLTTGVQAGDVIRYDAVPLIRAKAQLGGFWNSFCYTVPLYAAAPLTGFTTGDSFSVFRINKTFKIYSNTIGPRTSTSVANPLWDTTPSTGFTTAGVTAGDIVLNTNNYSAAATYATVVSVPNSNNNLAILSSNIMALNNNYSIVRLPSSATLVTVGYATAIPADFQIVDTHANFTGANPLAVAKGDVVYNVTTGNCVFVTSVIDSTHLEIASDIFNTANDKYIIYRGSNTFTVAYIEPVNEYLTMKSFRLTDGSAVGGAFTIDNTGVCSNPVAMADGAGNIAVFYQRGGVDCGKKMNISTGAAVWTQTYAGLGGFPAKQVLSSRALNISGGNGTIVLFAGATQFSVATMLSGDGSLTWSKPLLTGTNPNITVDRNLTAIRSRTLLVYETTHIVSLNTYTHIQMIGYDANGAVAIPATDVTSNTAPYNCRLPHITVSDNNVGVFDPYYISWYDGQYYPNIGFAIFAQRYTAIGAAFWTNPLYVSSPTSFGLAGELSMELAYYDDNGTNPYGIIPIWLDYRNAATAADIYYQPVTETGAKP